MGGPENGKFPLLYVVIMSLRRWVGGSKKPQNTLTYYKDGPLGTIHILRHHIFGIFGPPSPITSADVIYEWSLTRSFDQYF